MSSESYRQALDRAAEACGIGREYWDIWGRKHVVPEETQRAILQSMGVPSDSTEQLESALQSRQRKQWMELLPRCLVVSEKQSPVLLTLHLPGALAEETLQLEVRLENSGVQRFEISLGSVNPAEHTGFEDRWFVRKEVVAPLSLPCGYHDVQARVGDLTGAMRLIVAPERAWLHPELERGGRLAGVAVQLYGVRSGCNWGCGDLRDLRQLCDWAALQLGVSFIALNPLHAIPNRRPYNTSPYLPNCTFYQNFIYLNIEEIEEFHHSRRAQQLWSSSEIRAEIESLRNSEFVEYERVNTLKLRFLKLLFSEFLREYRNGSPRAQEFLSFVETEGELLDAFATYSALDEHIRRRHPDVWVWQEWPEEFRDPHSAAVEEFRKKRWRSVLLYKYIQWQLDQQLAAAQEYAQKAGLAVGLYHDLALATDRFGSDLWAHRPFYVSGCRVGSPPDDFSPKGQDWGFPPPHSEHHCDNGYRLFAESIRKNCRHGGALRIDHVMRFFRLYWIPDGKDAQDGAYVGDRYEDLLRILALESVRNRVVLVGEDLGTVEPFFRETLARFGVLSYRLFYFEKEQSGKFKPARKYPRQAVVSSTTHDLPTLAGFWIHEDIEARRHAGLFADEQQYQAQLADRGREKQRMLEVLFDAGLLPDGFPRSAAQVSELTPELHNAIIGFLAMTPSQLLLVNQEDLTKETGQQNLPATTSQYPNWSRKMKFSVEELRSHQTALDFTGMFRNWLEKTGRLNR